MRWPRPFRRSPHLPHVSTEKFDAAARGHGFTLDAGQRQVADLLGSHGHRSLYLWGPPGRGKTWLVDTYFESVETDAKLRIHFHEFFRDLHTHIRRQRLDGSRTQRGADAAIDRLLGDAQLACFDEFHVHDPADGTFVGRVLPRLLDRGVRLVVTSNYAPQDLLPNPLFHAGFVPTIDVIRSRMDVVALDGSIDHRTGSRRTRGFAGGRWIDRSGWADDQAGYTEFADRFGLTLPRPCEARVLVPAGRAVRARRADSRGVWFDFAELCSRPTAPADYLALADEYPFWVVDAVPDPSAVDRESLQRFANLVDVLHDRNVPTVFFGDVPVTAFLRDVPATTAGPLHWDAQRIVSRLRLLQTDQDETSARTSAGRSRARR